MNTKQAAAWLEDRGVVLQRDTIKRHILRGNIPARKLGRDWDVSEEALQQFLEVRRGPGWQLGRARKGDQDVQSGRD
jgi:excisionase family DNA binding protein